MVKTGDFGPPTREQEVHAEWTEIVCNATEPQLNSLRSMLESLGLGLNVHVPYANLKLEIVTNRLKTMKSERIAGQINTLVNEIKREAERGGKEVQDDVPD